MGSISRRSQRSINTWPGFVDVLATVLMVIIFLLMIFVIAQFFLNAAISGRDEALNSLESQVSELADMLALERRTTTSLRSDVGLLSQELQASVSTQDELRTTVRALTTRAESSEDKAQSLTLKLSTEKEKTVAQLREITALADQINALSSLRDELEARVTTLLARSESAESEAASLTQTVALRNETITEQLEELAAVAREIKSLNALKAQLEQDITALAGKVDETEGRLLSEQELSQSARAEVALLNQQMQALRDQLSQISAALEASETYNREQQVEIQNLGQRLNAALATKVHELSRYRSEFFGRLRDILGDSAGIQIVGDRFVLQSELLFERGSAEMGKSGHEQMRHLALTLKDLAARIPDDIDWVLRVDGHTDSIPISTQQFPSNWELSAARAISVVKYLIGERLPANRLAATGFGEYQPLESGQDETSMSHNRRIELKLTQR